jgi:hypothetical protein
MRCCKSFTTSWHYVQSVHQLPINIPYSPSKYYVITHYHTYVQCIIHPSFCLSILRVWLTSNSTTSVLYHSFPFQRKQPKLYLSLSYQIDDTLHPVSECSMFPPPSRCICIESLLHVSNGLHHEAKKDHHWTGIKIKLSPETVQARYLLGFENRLKMHSYSLLLSSNHMLPFIGVDVEFHCLSCSCRPVLFSLLKFRIIVLTLSPLPWYPNSAHSCDL